MALTALDVMQSHVITISPDDPLSSVQRLLFEEEIHAAPVVDDEGRVIGMVSSMDLLRAAAEEADTDRADSSYMREAFELSGGDGFFASDLLEERLGSQVVSEVMTEGPVCVEADASIPEIARTLRQRKIHHVLVVENGALRGIVSTFDLVGLLEKA